MSDDDPTLSELTKWWPVGDTREVVFRDRESPQSVDGLTPWKKVRIVFEDVEYRDDSGRVVTTLSREMKVGHG